MPKKTIASESQQLSIAQGNRVKYLRKITHLSRRAFALKHGISPGTLQNCEDGRYLGGLTDKMAQTLILAFRTEGIECELNWLLYGEGQEPQHRFEHAPNSDMLNKAITQLDEISLLQRALENEKRHKLNANLFDGAANGRYQDVVNLIKLGVNAHLMEGIEVKPYQSEHNTPLHLAASHGYLDIVKYLLKKGAKIGVKNRKGQTALHLAVLNAHKDVIQYLVQEGADINAIENEGDTPLSWAAYRRQAGVVQQLVHLGADIHSKNKMGNTALHWAAEKGYKDIVELLLELGANPNDVNNDRNTPLLLATQNGHIDTVKFLLSLQNLKR